jgi:Cu-processing system permease protein
VVVVYDLGLLALLVHDTDLKISSDLLAVLIAINPTDAYRLFNITSAESAAMVSGMSNLAEENIWSPVALVSVLVVWVIALLTLNQSIFASREL